MWPVHINMIGGLSNCSQLQACMLTTSSKAELCHSVLSAPSYESINTVFSLTRFLSASRHLINTPTISSVQSYSRPLSSQSSELWPTLCMSMWVAAGQVRPNEFRPACPQLFFFFLLCFFFNTPHPPVL